MAKCCVCGKKLGILSGESFSIQHNNLLICDECQNNRSNINVKRNKNINQKTILNSREYFRKCINAGTVEQEVLPAIENMIEESVLAEEKNNEYHNRKKLFKMTNGYNFEGYHISDYLNIVSAETVLGTGFLSEFSSQISDVFGTNSGMFEGKIATAKDMAVKNLVDKALDAGANALIGVDFDLMTLSNNIIVVSANGTAVVIDKK